ncbi:MAG TPA: SH3 domain-containing C40 family peptidase [Gemmatimonadaceae bacterium]|nr:SH3 domain-containing C40 family peptidase [Gemmatimonadaceae bacterium]
MIEQDAPAAIGAGAIVHAAVAPMLAQPHVSSGQINQQLAGHAVEILEDEGDWLLVRGADAYEGWMHRGYVARGEGAAGAAVGAAANDARISLGCTTSRPAGGRRALPLRAVLAPDETVTSGEAISCDELAARFPTDPAAITRSAHSFFLGTSYQWGGVTPWGADCSGLVQSVFALHGVQLPRDAWQQATCGDQAGNDPLTCRAGDLLFFSDRADHHITHVAISLGSSHIVHLALGRGGHATERLTDTGDPYVRTLLRRFRGARRVL